MRTSMFEVFKHIAYYIFICFLLLVIFPLLVIIGVLIASTSGLPILYTQVRTGKNRKPFQLHKFRSMRSDAEKAKSKYTHLNEADGPAFKIHNDPRFTSLGKFLSHTGLDELPQIWNIVKGDMSLIGPRPLPESEAKKLSTWMQERHIVKPGIISPWVLEGYHSRSFEDWMKSDIQYARNKNILYDMCFSLRALVFMFSLLMKESAFTLRRLVRHTTNVVFSALFL